MRWTAGHPPLSALKTMVRGVQRSTLLGAARTTRHTVVLKDPFLSLSLGFVAEHLTDRPVVIATRHPAAWCMSLRRVGWHPGTLLEHLRRRPELSGVVEETGLPVRAWTEVSILEAAAWTWTVLTAALRRQVASLPAEATVVVSLESMREAPAESALAVVDRVGLRRSPRSAARVRRLTEGSEVVPSTTQQHVLQRDTRSSVDAWRTRLDPADQAMIWAVCADVAEGWYDS